MKVNRAEVIFFGVIGLCMLGWLFIGVTLYYIFFPEIALKILSYTTSIFAFVCLGLVLYFLITRGFSTLVNAGLEPDTIKDKKKQKRKK